MITIERAQDRCYYVRGLDSEQSVIEFVRANPGCTRVEAGRVKRHYRLGVNAGRDLVTRMIESGKLRVESREGWTFSSDGRRFANGQFTDYIFLGGAR